jgi:hypothetical protein
MAAPVSKTPVPARFSVGIDLGTTHTALAYSDLAAERLSGEGAPRPAMFEIPQVTHPGTVASRALLPSFLYFPHASELPKASVGLPWDDERAFVVGELARNLGALTPVRVVSSAKSWLCHPTLDRRAATLPAGSPDEVPKVSPLEASARYLSHLREAWNAVFAKKDAKARLEAQRVTLTVPASFDEAARELTVEAAKTAGLANVTLLEEPQAALYGWVRAMGESWRTLVRPGDLLLVVDVGGGTTDFSLIAVVDRDGELGLERVAVGDHILLGGDNMDLALAVALQGKLSAAGKKIERWQFLALTHAARQAKEALFADPRREAHPVSVPGRGSSLVGGALRTELTQEELLRALVEGFFPKVAVDAQPASQIRAGLTQLGLPYATDAAVTRHLVSFLRRHRGALDAVAGSTARSRGATMLHPSAILFNGGVMKAGALKERVLESVRGWVASEGGADVRELPGAELDLAVAQGAAVFGEVRASGHGIRIRGGTARAHYVGIESSMPAVPGMPPPLRAVCVAPMGMEEGTSAELPGAELGLVVGEPAKFRLFASTLRRDDRAGTIVEEWEGELEELPEVETTLPAGDASPGTVVPVRLRSHVTEIGTLELECVERSGRAWKLEFNLRGSAP